MAGTDGTHVPSGLRVRARSALRAASFCFLCLGTWTVGLGAYVSARYDNLTTGESCLDYSSTFTHVACGGQFGMAQAFCPGQSSCQSVDSSQHLGGPLEWSV